MSRRAIRAHYEPRIARHRENYKILDWASPATQRARFQVLTDNVPLGGKSLLDVGCGLGDLWAHLCHRGIEARYTGVDILDAMVRQAQRQHPGVHFVHADIFESNPFGPRAFDVVFASGIFNLNLGNNLAFLPVALGRMFEIVREHVVFNLLHVRSAGINRQYAFYDPQAVLEILRPFPCEVRLVDDYLANDFTVICRLAEGTPELPPRK